METPPKIHDYKLQVKGFVYGCDGFGRGRDLYRSSEGITNDQLNDQGSG